MTAVQNSTTALEEKFDIARKEVGRILDDSEELLETARTRGEETGELQTNFGSTRSKWSNQRFRVGVMALVKAGKSTLINAWLGREFLPSSNTPETAKIVRVRHKPEDPKGTLKEGENVIARGSSESSAFLRQQNANVRDDTEKRATEDEMVLEAPLLCLADRSLGNQGFEILDTPGPNEAGAEMLRAKVERLLHDVDVIIYLLDYTKLKTEEEEKLFAKLAETRQELLKSYESRLFFIVNKIDLKNRHGLTPEKTAAYVAELLQRQIPGLNISPNRVLLTSAELALLARLIQNGHASREVVIDFAKKVFGELDAEEKTLEDCQPAAPRLLSKSRLLEVEETVLSFIYSNSGQLLLGALLDDIERYLRVLHNFLSTTQQTLEIDQKTLADALTQLKKEIQENQEKFLKLESDTKHIKKQTEEWIREEFGTFQKEVDDKIGAVLSGGGSSKSELEQQSSWFSLSYPFQRLRDSLSSILGGAKEKTTDEVKAIIGKLNTEISDYLRYEFDDFRQRVEQNAGVRQRDLFRQLKKGIEPLMRQIEKRLSQSLRISLQPTPVQFSMPSLDELHNEMKGRIDSFIRKQTDKENYVETKRIEVKPEGWCSDAEYENQSVTKTREVTKISVALDEIRQAWSTKIRHMTEISVRTARHVIDQEIGQAVDRARDELKTYSDSFVRILEKDINEKEQDEEQREQRLQGVGQLLSSTKEILSQIVTCREYLDRKETVS